MKTLQMWGRVYRSAIKSRLASWVALCIGLILLSGLIFHFEPTQIFASFQQLDHTWIWLVLLFLFLSTLIGAVNVYLLIDNANRPPLAEFFPVYWLSWGIGLAVPGQVGDIAALSLTFRKYGMNPSFTLGRTLLDKLISLFVMSIFAAGGLIYLAERVRWGYDAYALPALLAAIFCCLLLWRYFGLLSSFFNPGKSGAVGLIGRTASELFLAVRSFPGKIALNATFTLIKVALTGGAYWGMFAALGHDKQPILEIISLASLAGLVAYLPISFNGYGTVEMVGIVLFGEMGIPAAKVLAAYLGLRILVLAMAWLPSLVFIYFIQRANRAKK